MSIGITAPVSGVLYVTLLSTNKTRTFLSKRSYTRKAPKSAVVSVRLPTAFFYVKTLQTHRYYAHSKIGSLWQVELLTANKVQLYASMYIAITYQNRCTYVPVASATKTPLQSTSLVNTPL